MTCGILDTKEDHKKEEYTLCKTPPPKRPVRREVTGSILLVLALCVCVGYFGANALFIDWLAALLKGVFGYGYWLAAPALVLTGMILLLHRGRPVLLRAVCALLTPLFAGTLGHTLLCKEAYESSIGILVKLWESGNALHSGGVLSGGMAIGFLAVFGKVVSVVLFSLLLTGLLAVALWPALKHLAQRHRERPQYEEEEIQPVRSTVKEATPRRRQEAMRPQIDFPRWTRRRTHRSRKGGSPAFSAISRTARKRRIRSCRRNLLWRAWKLFLHQWRRFLFQWRKHLRRAGRRPRLPERWRLKLPL